MTRLRSALGWLVASLLMGSSALAAPTVVPYLGYLVYDTGAPFNGSVDVQVEFFSAAVGGSSLWGPHTFTDVAVLHGLFTLPLGGADSGDVGPALDAGSVALARVSH